MSVRRHNKGHEFLIERRIASEVDVRGEKVMVPRLGCRAADFLGELFNGLYKLPDENFRSHIWSQPTAIRVYIGDKPVGTYDGDFLTRMVFLAYAFGLRAELYPNKKNVGFDMVIMSDPTPPSLEHQIDTYRYHWIKED